MFSNRRLRPSSLSKPCLGSSVFLRFPVWNASKTQTSDRALIFITEKKSGWKEINFSLGLIRAACNWIIAERRHTCAWMTQWKKSETLRIHGAANEPAVRDCLSSLCPSATKCLVSNCFPTRSVRFLETRPGIRTSSFSQKGEGNTSTNLWVVSVTLTGRTFNNINDKH